MKRAKILNSSKNTVIADNARIARNYFNRLVGLLNRNSLAKGEGLVLDPCSSIHNIGMRFAIDAIFVDKRGVVLKVCEKMPPFSLSPIVFGAKKVIELPSGTAADTLTGPGDIMEILELED